MSETKKSEIKTMQEIIQTRHASGTVELEYEELVNILKEAKINKNDKKNILEEMNKFLKIGFKNEIKTWYKLAKERSNQGCVDSELQTLNEYILKSGLSYKSLKISKSKLLKLKIKGYESEIKKWKNKIKIAKHQA